MIDAYREAGGRGPLHLQVHLSWAPDAGRGRGDRARPVAQQRLPAAGLLGPRHAPSTSTPSPSDVTLEQVREVVHVSADLGRHAEQLAEYAELGFDEIALHHVGQEQDAFIDAFGAKVLPAATPAGVPA